MRIFALMTFPVTCARGMGTGRSDNRIAPLPVDHPLMEAFTVNDAAPPSVGVLLATYDGAAYCEDQILSLLWQRDVDVHVYVRDDGSRDTTLAIVGTLADRHPGRITLLDNEGVQTGSACGNFFALLAGVDLTTHAYFAFADQDDVWMPDKLRRAIDMMSDTHADGYSSDLIAYHERDGAAWMVRKQGGEADLDYLFQGASAGCTYVLSQQAARLIATVMAAAPALCRGASHDWIVYAICRTHGLAWVCDAAARILYRQHAANQYGTRRGLSEVAAKLRLIRSGWYRTQILWLRHVTRGIGDERRVLSAVERCDLRSRWWLIRNAPRFRRTSHAVLQLRVAIILGLL